MIKQEDRENVMRIYDSLLSLLDGVLVGQEKVKEAVALALMCDTNSKVLFTGGTGAGKSSLSNFLASGFDAEKIFISSDMLPSEIRERLKKRTSLRFLQIEEFNRANGRVQNAFIDLFSEKEINEEGVTYSFSDFYVFASQNSSEVAGIFTVPQALYDRFDMEISFEKLNKEDTRYLLFGDFCPSKKSEILLSDLEYSSSLVDQYSLNKRDVNLMMDILYHKIDEMRGLDGDYLFAGTNIRAHRFAIRMAKMHSLVEGYNHLFPSDIAFFISYIYKHRIDQKVASINDPGILNLFLEKEEEVLSLKREKKTIFLGSKKGKR